MGNSLIASDNFSNLLSPHGFVSRETRKAQALVAPLVVLPLTGIRLDRLPRDVGAGPSVRHTAA